MSTRFDVPVAERPDHGSLEGLCHYFVYNLRGELLQSETRLFCPIEKARDLAAHVNKNRKYDPLVFAEVVELEGEWRKKAAAKGGEA